MLIKNVSVLYGKDLAFIQNVNIIIENGVFETISKDPIVIDGEVYAGAVYDGEGSLMIPGLINAHTHIADSTIHYTQVNITTVGTIDTGVWQGTAIAKGYLSSGIASGDTMATQSSYTIGADAITVTDSVKTAGCK